MSYSSDLWAESESESSRQVTGRTLVGYDDSVPAQSSTHSILDPRGRGGTSSADMGRQVGGRAEAEVEEGGAR